VSESFLQAGAASIPGTSDSIEGWPYLSI